MDKVVIDKGVYTKTTSANIYGYGLKRGGQDTSGWRLVMGIWRGGKIEVCKTACVVLGVGMRPGVVDSG